MEERDKLLKFEYWKKFDIEDLDTFSLMAKEMIKLKSKKNDKRSK